MASNFHTQPQPNFFIVGAAKAGTTSLWMYLKQHPEIYMPPTLETKEPSFFCYLYGYKDFASYLSLFANAKGKKAIGEASHAYMTSPESAEWIHKVYPQAKIIIVLRNPIERAYSLYNWMIREGYEWIYPFEKALIAEEERYISEKFKHHNVQYYYNYLYFYSGLYKEQIKRYLELFSIEQIHIILFDDLQNNPVATTQRIYRFLGVNHNFIPTIEVYNKTQIPLSVPIQYFIRFKLIRYLHKLRIPAVSRIQRTAFSINLLLGSLNPNSLKASTKRNLQHRYKSNIQETANLINRDLGVWLKKN